MFPPPSPVNTLVLQLLCVLPLTNGFIYEEYFKTSQFINAVTTVTSPGGLIPHFYPALYL